ncbi:MAG: hypothetical protein H6581_18655 [Bacteroidia bacterium]|nr:hypothetical protein [Bacteroidia bacterium]
MAKDLYGIGSRISHPDFGKGVVTGINSLTYSVTFIDSGEEEIAKNDDRIMIIERIDPDHDQVSLWDVEQSLLGILKKWAGEPGLVPLGQKWRKGTILMQPFDRSLKPKEVPIDDFFHKIVMLRDRLRVMEQKINASKGLEEDEKVELQQYITRIYGTLTTFNVLFDDRDHYFVGSSSK